MTEIYDVDRLAVKLLDMAYVARNMPPSWDKAHHSHPIFDRDGNYLGRALPGRGIYVDANLSDLGFRSPPPHVFDRDNVSRMEDRIARMHSAVDPWAIQGAAIASIDDLINARYNGLADDVVAAKASLTSAAGFWYDMYRAGGNPTSGVFTPATTPPTQTANDRSTTGALSGMLRNPTGGRKKYLVSVGANIAAAHYFGILLDRHLTSGSHRLTVTSAETVASPVAVVRQYGVSGNNGVGNVIHMPVSTARATPGAGTLTVTYTDQDGNSAAGPALALPATADPVNRCLAHIHVGIPFIRLNDGDYGVRSVSETQRAATADTTGIASLAVSQPLAFVPNLGILGMYTEVDLPNQMAGLVELADSSGTLGCYYFMMYANGTSGAHQLLLRTIEG